MLTEQAAERQNLVFKTREPGFKAFGFNHCIMVSRKRDHRLQLLRPQRALLDQPVCYLGSSKCFPIEESDDK